MRSSIHSLLPIVLAAIAFAHCANAVSVRARDVELAAREVSSDKTVFEYDGGKELMAPDDVELVRRAGWTFNNNQKLATETIVASVGVAAAACATGNPVNCAVGSTFAVFGFFFAVYALSDRAAGVPGEIANPFFVYPPTPQKTLVQRLESELETGKWHPVGHVHHLGLNHTVEYFNTGPGKIQKLRARNVPFWNEAQAGLEGRSDPDNDGGFVADYSWINNNVGPYDSFHSTEAGTSFFAANAGGWMIGSTTIAACAEFLDSDGGLADGLLTLGWNNQEFLWTEPGEEEAAYNKCASDGV